MSARKLPWLIAYDIRSPRRLARIHRWLSRHAAPVQYSVFIGRYDKGDLDWLCAGIRSIIDERVDDVRLYPLPEEPCMTTLGAQRCPSGWSLLATLQNPSVEIPTLGSARPCARRGTQRQVIDGKGGNDP
jgi:CRISPR-associated protein Cas2